MSLASVPTRGRTLDHAARIYDVCEPLFMAGRQSDYNSRICALLDLLPAHRVLDLGCGTGTLTRLIADRLDAWAGGVCIGIDAAGRMIEVARKKRQGPGCCFEVAAAENLPYADESFDAVVTSLFLHHVDLDLKRRICAEAFRVLRPKGRFIVADMHTPTSLVGRLISYAARWLLVQPEIGENIRGVLPVVMRAAGFCEPQPVATYCGYIAVFTTVRPAQRYECF
jgi:ubiquinone/menaquinone biosynthesis C-methylase UbiE